MIRRSSSLRAAHSPSLYRLHSLQPQQPPKPVWAAEAQTLYRRQSQARPPPGQSLTSRNRPSPSTSTMPQPSSTTRGDASPILATLARTHIVRLKHNAVETWLVNAFYHRQTMDDLARYELLEITQPTLDLAGLQSALDAPPPRSGRSTTRLALNLPLRRTTVRRYLCRQGDTRRRESRPGPV